MKLRALAIVTGCLAVQVGLAATQTAAPTANSPIKTENDKVSYTMGVDLGKNLMTNSVQINTDLFAQGLKDSMSGGKLLMTDADMKQALSTFREQLIAKQKQHLADMASKNAKEGTDFLTANKAKPGVQTLKDGLQYKVITPGTGASPKATDTVTVDYEGKLIDGTVFDSSYNRGKPATFQVGQVIPGWQEALTQMKVGDTWELYIPSNLAYGENGIGGPIGPNQTLIFKIHLIDIKKQDTAKNG